MTDNDKLCKLIDWGRKELATATDRVDTFHEDFKARPHDTTRWSAQKTFVAVARKKLLHEISTMIHRRRMGFDAVRERLQDHLVTAATCLTEKSGNEVADMMAVNEVAALGWALCVVTKIDDDG
jgi:hypothetical protein